MATTRSTAPSIKAASRAIEIICIEAGDPTLLDPERRQATTDAVDRGDTPALFGILMRAFSFQGISDTIAAGYLATHGFPTYEEVLAVAASSTCPKLRSYWHFEDCSYHKGSCTCAEPELIDACSLPQFNMRNGRLNQTSQALALFIRDIADGELVNWIDSQLAHVPGGPPATRPRQLAQSIVDPLRGVYGISDKVINMAMSEVLLAGGASRPLWLEAGGAMIAIDSLVHNWLHRTGILHAFDCEHPYGEACYAQGGCRDLVEHLASKLDASHFNSVYPPNFPRFVQKSIWSFCAQAGMAQCNGVTIDDRHACDRDGCPVWRECAKKPLKPAKNQST